MASNPTKNSSSKKDIYLLKFQQYQEEKEKQKKGQREQTKVSVPKGQPQSIRKPFNVKNYVVKTTLQSKENENPTTKPGINTLIKTPVSTKPTQKTTSHTKPALLTSQQKWIDSKVSNTKKPVFSEKRSNSADVRRKSIAVTSRDGFLTKDKKSNPGDVRRESIAVTSHDRFLTKDKRSNPADVRRQSIAVTGTSQNKFQTKDRKTNGQIVQSRYQNFHSKKSVSDNNIQKNKPNLTTNDNKKSNVVPKSRRHSVTLKEKRLQKPTSILKRKSCFASIEFETATDTVGKTPDHGRSVRFISPAAQGDTTSVRSYRKTPKRPNEQSCINTGRQPTPIPKQSVKRPTEQSCINTGRQPTPIPKQSVKKHKHEEQKVMRSKLDDWLKSKGRTPSKFRHLMCFHDKDDNHEERPDSCTKRNLTVEELSEQKATIDREEDNIVVNLASQFRDAALDELDSMLEECTTLYEAGCPREDILRWLDSIEENIKLTKTYAKFYICKAQVLKSAENLEKVLEIYETAVVNGAQPSIELATALTGIVKELCHEREKKARKRSAAEVQQENIFESSAIKYTVRQVTPFSKKRRKSANDVQLSPCDVITPVRRSTRRSISCLPFSLQDKTPTYKSLDDMSAKDKKKTLFFPNDALGDDGL